MSKLTCPIVRDLLPLYIDQVVSPETAQAVEDHLGDCPDCRREYESLTADLPVPLPEGTDTSRQFGDMMKKTKRRETLRAVLSVVLVAATLVGTFFVIFQCPLQVVDNQGVTIYRVFRYEAKDGQERFHILFSRPFYSGLSGLDYEFKQEGDKDILQLNMKRNPFKDPTGETWEWNYDIPSAEWADITEVRLGDEVLWTEEANGNDPIPAYVYEYDNSNANLGSSQTTVQTWTIELDGEENFTDYPAPFIWVNYKDGRQIVWDLDGNVLRETP